MSDEDDVIICRCQEVSRGEILKAIAGGARTVDGVKKRTRAGMGLCQGKSCQRLVAQIIAKETGRNMADLPPPTFRAPVRPVKIGIITSAASGGEDNG
jgi:NAD(P)H-nitrite reductase large subunit